MNSEWLEKRKNGRRTGLAENIEKPVKESGLRRLETWAIIIAAFALIFDIGWGFFVERPIQEQERAFRAQSDKYSAFAQEVQAWQLLTDRTQSSASLNSAFQIVSRNSRKIRNLDFSCESYGVKRERGECSPSISQGFLNFSSGMGGSSAQKISVSDVSFSGNRLKIDGDNSSFVRVDFSHAYLSGSFVNSYLTYINGTKGDLWEVDFSESNMIKSNFSDSKFIRGKLIGTDCHHCVFNRTKFFGADLTNFDFNQSEITEATFYSSNISGTKFDRDKVPAKNLLNFSFAWSDMPPEIVKERRLYLLEPDKKYSSGKRALVTDKNPMLAQFTCDARIRGDVSANKACGDESVKWEDEPRIINWGKVEFRYLCPEKIRNKPDGEVYNLGDIQKFCKEILPIK